ncbi:MAG TPA: putative baseplate assembly protein [Haliangium sp.]|nr:putative baseplate assembly protein [Haliangium sp.]
MSKPPRPHYSVSTTATPSGRRAVLDYLPLEYSDFIDMQTALARTDMGIVSAGEEGDFARTLMEMSAILGHVLGVYQDRFANEAFLATAQSAQGLVRHGRRLGYQVDTGMAASGRVKLTIGDGLSGRVTRGFAISSVPEGEEQAQGYETIADLDVHAAHNQLDIADAASNVTLSAGQTEILVRGQGYGFRAGDLVVITGGDWLHADVITSVAERDGRNGDGVTTLILRTGLGSDAAGRQATDVSLLARPRTQLRMFGWNADPETFPPDKLKHGGKYTDPPLPDAKSEESPTQPQNLHTQPQDSPTQPIKGSGYLVYRDGTAQGEQSNSTPAWYSHVVYLDRAVEEPLGEILIEDVGGVVKPRRLAAQHAVSVIFKTGRWEEGMQPASQAEAIAPQLITWSFSGAVTGIELSPDSARSAFDLQTIWHTHFQIVAPLAATAPNRQLLRTSEPIMLAGPITGLYPGQDLLFEDSETGTVEAVRITSFTGQQMRWTGDSGTHEWRKDSTVIHGNIARITHGTTVEEILGSSSGTEPFLRFALKKSPVTILPTGSGEPAIEVRVNDIVWERVDDLWTSDAEDRHYLVEHDHEGTTWIVFGDGRRGAIPPAGKKNIACTYRVGLGSQGNARAGQVRRIVKSHPLVKAARNFLPVIGGADPASPAEVRTQATRHIRTFDRAVSLTDHADLALLYPGVARARAWWGSVTYAGGRTVPVIHLVAATSTGGAVDDTGLRAYMERRRDNHVPLIFTGVVPRSITIALELRFDPAYFKEKVKDAIRAALTDRGNDAPGLFTFAARDLGQPAYLSELYELLTAVEGVLAVEVIRFCPQGRNDVCAVIACDPNEWLSLDKGNIAFDRGIS